MFSGLSFNESKTKCQTISRKRSPVVHQYQLKGKNIAKVDTERDLGIWMTSDLTWSKQVCAQTAAANKLLGRVRRGFLEILKASVRRTTYLATVRPHLGYSTQVWSPQSVELIRRVERVQRRTTKFILSFQTFHSALRHRTKTVLQN